MGGKNLMVDWARSYVWRSALRNTSIGSSRAGADADNT
jgi:hypothetical protein